MTGIAEQDETTAHEADNSRPGADRGRPGAQRDGAKPVRGAPLVYALSALITVLGGYWFLTRVFVA